MHDADKKIPGWTEENIKLHFPNGMSANDYRPTLPYDPSMKWKALLASSIIGLIGVLMFILLSACAPMQRDDGMGDLWKGVRYMEQRR